MDLLLHERTLTKLDHARLTRLLPADARHRHREAGVVALHTALDSADLVPSRSVPPDVVTMYSRVQVSEAATGGHQVLTLCYPADAEPAEGFVSVLSPVGAALLGLRVGALAQWRTPAGRSMQVRLTALLFQPEASGDFTL